MDKHKLTQIKDIYDYLSTLKDKKDLNQTELAAHSALGIAIELIESVNPKVDLKKKYMYM